MDDPERAFVPLACHMGLLRGLPTVSFGSTTEGNELGKRGRLMFRKKRPRLWLVALTVAVCRGVMVVED